MSTAGWVSIGLSVAAIAISGYTIWQTRRTMRLTRERIARAEAKRKEGPSRCRPTVSPACDDNRHDGCTGTTICNGCRDLSTCACHCHISEETK